MTRAMRQLSMVNLKELLRDPTTFFFVLVFPFLFIAMFAFISSSTGKNATVGGEAFDGFRFGLPAVLVLAFGQLAFLGTATTMVQLRSRGTLRLLALTPLRRLTFIAALVPARLMIAVAQLVVMAAIAAATGFLEVGQIGRLLLSCAFGLAMLFALGFFLGGRISSPEVAAGALSGLLPVLLIASGILLPIGLLPGAIAHAADFIPLTYLGDAVRQDLVGAQALHPIGLDYLVMAATTVVFTLLSALTFRWDQGE